ncbi:Ig-like domain-containing protein [Streptacidiphilus sp. ASG 303]|uniref:L,D-transpeptidase n=1 Tax=Streptacidiphilus sp. ASG 303 TaxID=2896847 RepID=UPI001E2FD0C2|nr:Ig-like domain-containing protein [Streptacidiphilus sp. ASG 303]MCD0483018.1 Ig-like domain-containing protein [Streptacidiphilus sp. ASG 303]
MKPEQAAAAAIRPSAVRGRNRGAARGALALLLGLLLALVTACSSGGSKSSDASGGKGGADKGASQADKAAAQKTSDAVISITPKDGASNVPTRDALKVTVAKGKLTSVKVTSESGAAVAGALAADGSSWTPADSLNTGVKYRVEAHAKDAKNLEAVENATFTTLTPANTFIGYFNTEQGQTYGVGMIVSLRFNKPIANRKDVLGHIKVTANPAVDVVGHWVDGQRLDFRPKDYWAPGTQVTLGLRLNGVQGSPGVYGVQSKDVKFSIGRSQVSLVDAEKHTMTVRKNGAVLRTIPISAGSPQNTTYNGRMVISEKYTETRMNGDSVGFKGEYDIKDVPHAMRLTTSGTFVHGNYWGRPDIFGAENTSHGCVGLRDAKGAKDPGTPGAWFFSHSLIGDVVEVVHSHDRTVDPFNGINGWNMDWSQWTAGS